MPLPRCRAYLAVILLLVSPGLGEDLDRPPAGAFTLAYNFANAALPPLQR